MKLSIRFIAAAAVAAACGLAAAQTATTPKPPAKGQATAPSIVMPSTPAPRSSKPKTLGGKAVQGKLLTRDELRACMKRLDDVNHEGKPLEQRRAALDAEKTALVKSGDELKAEREGVDRHLAAVREWEGRVKAHGQEIEAFNKRSATYDDTPRNQKDALKAELDAERARLTKAREAISADEARLVPVYQASVKAYNEHATARDATVNDWNQRNAAINEAAKKTEDARTSWLLECADRPYREDDEIAIKAGK